MAFYAHMQFRTTVLTRQIRMNIDNRRDILLLLLYTPGNERIVNVPIIGRTRIVKMLFLFKEEEFKRFKQDIDLSEQDFYEFLPWYFGPFCADVYNDLRFFELRDFIRVNETKEETLSESAEEWALWLSSSDQNGDEEQFTEYEEVAFSLTNKGCKFVKLNLLPNLSNAQKKLLWSFRRKYEKTPLRAILKYVYETYPEQTKKSKIREEFIGT